MGLNRFEIEGVVGQDGQIKSTKEGLSILSFSVAWNDYKNGQKGPTSWFNVSVFGKYAESLNGKVSKGMLVLVVGRLEMREWVDKNQTQRLTPSIAAEAVRFIQKSERPPTRLDAPQESYMTDSDVPF